MWRQGDDIKLHFYKYKAKWCKIKSVLKLNDDI